MKESLSQIIRERIDTMARGRLFTIDDFLDIGNDPLVARTLSRLDKRGVVVRMAAGIYLNPKKNKNKNFSSRPSLDDIARKIASRNHVAISPTGASALRVLGLPVPKESSEGEPAARPVTLTYLTNGSRRCVRVGVDTIIFKNASPKNFLFRGSLLPLVIAALQELGRKGTTEAVVDRVEELILGAGADERLTMMFDTLLAPAWIRRLIMPAVSKVATRRTIRRPKRKLTV
ncbi:MAG: DUF6088 family protein [Alistipes sp.]|jgi:hypothetical protein|nr:DUF6088 family protein [Alistipes sp.]